MSRTGTNRHQRCDVIAKTLSSTRQPSVQKAYLASAFTALNRTLSCHPRQSTSARLASSRVQPLTGFKLDGSSYTPSSGGMPAPFLARVEREQPPCPSFSPERNAPGSMSVYSDLSSSSSADHLSVWSWCIQCRPPVCLGLGSLYLGSSPLRCLCDHGCGCAAAYA